ncbi:hypothetical protein TCAL_03420 [Tigriopus californicus]|uniref:Uncharacterized protein n=1 Tax=Tigriopus californicus TaxID=6832 RepID=A0A553P3P5_TIGCA|nr:hypothetical protein TCAL_03420 [Tigriopus californicus]
MGMVVSAAISAVPFMDELEQPYPQLSPPKTISPPTKQRPSAQRPTRATSKGPSEPLKPVKPVNTIG